MTCDRVLLAAPRSFCAGVDMAIKALTWMVRFHGAPVYCYHEIVHNDVVVGRFRRAGVVFVDDIAEVPPGAPLMLSAHGSAPEVVREARQRAGVVVDAVCPLVRKVHHEVRRRSAAGDAVVYAGHAGHDEAVGTLALAPGAVHLVERPDDVAGLDGITSPVAFLAQTTLSADEWDSTLAAVRARFGDVWVPRRSDLCFATTNRQDAVRALAPRCDAVVVIGSSTSSNTAALVDVARPLARGPVVRVGGADDLPSHLQGTVGVTAGASAPEELVEAVVARLAPRQGVEVVDLTTEDEYFPPPRGLRDMARSFGAEHLLDDDRSVAAADALVALDRRLPSHPPTPASLPSPAPGAGGPCPAAHPPARAAGGSAAPGPGDPAGTAAVPELLRSYAGPVEREMASVVASVVTDPLLQGMIGYHLGWHDEAFAPLRPGRRSGGKKLRAAVAVLAYRSAAAASRTRAGKAAAPASAGIGPVLPLAAAAELFHNWTLIHDDIEDGDRTRRGRPALWALVGEAQAINVGDCMHALSFVALTRLSAHGVDDALVASLASALAGTGVALTEGQMRDLVLESTVEVDLARYLDMVAGKTAALLSFAAYGGALAGGRDESVARVFGEFGRCLGLAFQARDDVLGIWGTDAETGKPTGADIRRRKKSLPVVIALERLGGPDGDRLRRLYLHGAPLGPADERFVLRALEACDARAVAQLRAERYRDEAVTALQQAAPGAAATEHIAALGAVAAFVTSRNR